MSTFEIEHKSEEKSLRDWFAGQALAGLLACPEWEPPPGDSFAKAAYRQADDMMKERTL